MSNKYYFETNISIHGTYHGCQHEIFAPKILLKMLKAAKYKILDDKYIKYKNVPNSCFEY